MAEALDAWLEVSGPTWAVSTLRDQSSRVSLVKRDVIARTVIGRLTVADVDRWHARLRGKGVGESSIRNQHLVMRASMSQAARWGWVATRWVGVDAAGRVVADAQELDELLDSLDAAGIVGATVQRIPALDEPLFVGLR